MLHGLGRAVLVSSFVFSLSACGGEPEWVVAYEDCKSKMTEAMEEMKSEQGGAGSDSPEAQAMVKAMGDMAMAMGLAVCESIKQTCEPDPDAAACQSMMQSYRDSQNADN